MGTVVKIESPEDLFHKKITLEVQTVWKGGAVENVVILTGRGDGDCGYPFEVDSTYLIYTYQYTKTQLGTNSCQRTAGFQSDLVDLKYLGKPLYQRGVVKVNSVVSTPVNGCLKPRGLSWISSVPSATSRVSLF
jgi:hypothetical protein